MKLGQTIDRAVRELGMLVRIGDPKALKRVAATLRKHGGSIVGAAAELGVSSRTLQMWTREVPQLAEHTRGRQWVRPSDKEIAEVIATLKKHDGKITFTADALGISYHTLYRLIDELPEVAKHAGGFGNRRPRRKRAA